MTVYAYECRVEGTHSTDIVYAAGPSQAAGAFAIGLDTPYNPHGSVWRVQVFDMGEVAEGRWLTFDVAMQVQTSVKWVRGV